MDGAVAADLTSSTESKPTAACTRHPHPLKPPTQRQYRGSAGERTDLLRHYSECGGDMAKVFAWVMLSRPDVDAPRFMAVIDEAIDKGE